MGAEQQAQRVGLALAGELQVGQAIQLGHAEVADDRRVAMLGQRLQRRLRVVECVQGPTPGAQLALQGREDVGLVVHQLDLDHRVCSLAGPATASGWRSGSQTRKRVPWPGWLETSMRPLCFCTML
ncbi:hypothetical protein D9M68_816970 [compost metagenome]